MYMRANGAAAQTGISGISATNADANAFNRQSDQ